MMKQQPAFSTATSFEIGESTGRHQSRGNGPARIEQTIWWHVYPLGFVGAERSGRTEPGVVHRLGHIESWLDYAVELGATGLALGPIFASSTHGYDTVDHFEIDPRLGDKADFAALIQAAHGRGLKVLLDGVFNHVGRAFRPSARRSPRGPAHRAPPGSAAPGRRPAAPTPSPGTRPLKDTVISPPSITMSRRSPTISLV